jgi:hypothetical protein
LVKLETRPPSDGKPRASTAANDTNATVENGAARGDSLSSAG